MKLSSKTIEKLRLLINEETEYRSGPKLINFFNDLGFSDTYSQDFPSRWIYTEEKLKQINGTKKIDKVIKKLFSPINFIGEFPKLDRFVQEFNEYLAFDDYKIVKNGKNIIIKKGNFEYGLGISEMELLEDEFVKKEFKKIQLEQLGFDLKITTILKQRLNEIERNLKSNSPLSAIFLAGSTLEGILYGVAKQNLKKFNQAKSAPKDKDGKIKKFEKWTLGNYIDIAEEVGFIKKDTKKFSHTLRNFRNYIHPYRQVVENFSPDTKTANLCWKVLELAIYQISNKK